MLPKLIFNENLKKHKKQYQKTLKTRSNLGPRPPGPLPSVQTPKKKNRLNGIPNGPILKGFVTISHKIIKKSLPDRPLRGRSAAPERPLRGRGAAAPRPRSGRSGAAERPRSGRSGNDFFMILCEMVTKPFKIGPFGMPLRRFFFFGVCTEGSGPGGRGPRFDRVFNVF